MVCITVRFLLPRVVATEASADAEEGPGAEAGVEERTGAEEGVAARAGAEGGG